MIKFVAIAVLGAVSFAASASAQTDFQDRVRNLMDNMPTTPEVLSDGNQQETLSPFYGQAAPEADLDHQNFDEEEVLRQSGDGMVARAYGNQKDSALSRPDMGLTVDDLALADGAIETSDDTLGGIFNGSVGSCEADFEGGYTVGEQFCRRNLSATTQACQQRRVASVDRDDRWECLVDTPTYKKVCGGEINYSCSGSTGVSCLSNSVSVVGGGATITRSGGRTYLVLPRGSDTCGLITRTVNLRIAPSADLTGLRLGSYNRSSIMQVRTGTNYLHTSSYIYYEENFQFLSNPTVITTVGSVPLSTYTDSLSCIGTNVYSGSNRLGSTSDRGGLTERNLNVNLTGRVGAPSRSSNIESNGTVNVSMGPDRTIALTFTFSGSFSFNPAPRIELLLAGSCCSNVTAQVDLQCN